MAEQKTAQLRARERVISQYGTSPFWETPTRARFLIETGQFYLVNAPNVGANELKPIGPSAIKPAGPQEKKTEYSSVAPDGPSTDFPSSIEPGPAASLSSSAADPALPLTNASLSPKRGRPRKLQA